MLDDEGLLDDDDVELGELEADGVELPVDVELDEPENDDDDE